MQPICLGFKQTPFKRGVVVLRVSSPLCFQGYRVDRELRVRLRLQMA